jgi:hypothetical protein
MVVLQVTAAGLWGHIAVKTDSSINQSDNNDLQRAANDLCELYRTFCLEIEYAFLAALQKQQEHKRSQAHSIGQSPSQAPSQQAQAPTPQNHRTPQPPFQQADTLGDQRVQQGPMDGQLHHPQQIKPPSQAENVDKDSHGAPHHPFSHPQGQPHPQLQSQQTNIHSTQPPAIHRDFASHNGFSQTTAPQSENCQPTIPQGRLGGNSHMGSHSTEDIMAMSDDRLRELQVPEESIMKIRQARAQNQNKFASHNPGLPSHQAPQANQLRSSTGPWAGPTSAAEEGGQICGPDMLGRPSSTGVTMTKLSEASAVVNTMRSETLPQAQACKSR